MPTTSTLAAYLSVVVVLVVIPGPNVLFLLARGIAGGRRVAVVSTFGVETATATFVVATAVGIVALIQSSAIAFEAMRFGGAAYLVYLGIRALRDREGFRLTATGEPAGSAWRWYGEGFAVGISNPKVALFFLSFLPQFVDPDRGSTLLQVLLLGGIFLAVGLVSDLTLAMGAGSIGRFLARHPRSRSRQGLVTGPILIALGATALFTGSRPTT